MLLPVEAKTSTWSINHDPSSFWSHLSPTGTVPPIACVTVEAQPGVKLEIIYQIATGPAPPRAFQAPKSGFDPQQPEYFNQKLNMDRVIPFEGYYHNTVLRLFGCGNLHFELNFVCFRLAVFFGGSQLYSLEGCAIKRPSNCDKMPIKYDVSTCSRWRRLNLSGSLIYEFKSVRSTPIDGE